MKGSRVFTALLLCLVPSSAVATEFEGYRIPETSWRRYDLSIGGDSRHTSANPTGSYFRGNLWVGGLSGGYALGRDSDPFQWEARLDASLNGVRTGETGGEYAAPLAGTPPGSTYASTDRERREQLREAWRVAASARWYPWPVLVGLELAGSLQGDEEQWWDRRESRSRSALPGSILNTLTIQSAQQWFYREAAEVQATVGLGRVRDATPIFLALLLEERLQRDGRLQRTPSAAARQRLAELLSLRDDFSRVHSLPEKHFWAEVERLLREDGALAADGLDAFAAQHAAEGLAVARSAFVRTVGWFAGPVLSARHSHNLSRLDGATSSLFDDEVSPPIASSTRSGSRITSSFESVMAGGRADYARPMGPRLQASVATQVLAGVKGDDDLIVSGAARLQRLVGERWFAEAHVFNNRSILRSGGLHANWYVIAGGAISYFLEDFCRAEFSLDRLEGVREDSDLPSYRFHRIDLVARLSVSVGRGRLDAPGLLAPVRPMH